MKKSKSSFKKIWKTLNSWVVLYGMFSNFGLIVISMLAGTYLTLIITPELASKLIPPIYLFLSIGFYFPIKKLKDFRLGYIMAFILGEILLLTVYYFSN